LDASHELLLKLLVHVLFALQLVEQLLLVWVDVRDAHALLELCEM